MSLFPSFILCFANDTQRPLSDLTEEKRAIHAALETRELQHHYRVVIESTLDSNELIASFRRYHNHLQMLHFGGHCTRMASNYGMVGLTCKPHKAFLKFVHNSNSCS